MKLLLLALCVVILGGCNGSYVTPAIISEATRVCENNGGLLKLYITSVSACPVVYCKNGARFYPDNDQIKEKTQ